MSSPLTGLWKSDRLCCWCGTTPPQFTASSSPLANKHSFAKTYSLAPPEERKQLCTRPVFLLPEFVCIHGIFRVCFQFWFCRLFAKNVDEWVRERYVANDLVVSYVFLSGKLFLPTLNKSLSLFHIAGRFSGLVSCHSCRCWAARCSPWQLRGDGVFVGQQQVHVWDLQEASQCQEGKLRRSFWVRRQISRSCNTSDKKQKAFLFASSPKSRAFRNVCVSCGISNWCFFRARG